MDRCFLLSKGIVYKRDNYNATFGELNRSEVVLVVRNFWGTRNDMGYLNWLLLLKWQYIFFILTIYCFTHFYE